MKRRLYVIRDNVAGEAAGPPMAFAHDAVAVRSFSDIASDPQTQLGRHVKDHDLVLIGEYDSETLIVDGLVPTVVLRGEMWAASRESAES